MSNRYLLNRMTEDESAIYIGPTGGRGAFEGQPRKQSWQRSAQASARRVFVDYAAEGETKERTQMGTGERTK